MKKFLLKIRTWSAFLSGIILNLGNTGIRNHGICSPTYNCHGCPLSTFACPIGASAFQASIGQIPLYPISFLLFIGAISGRFICGFICPAGLFQDCMHKIPSPKIKIPRWTRYMKYAVLVLLVFALPYFMGVKYSGFLQITDLKLSNPKSASTDYVVNIENNSTEDINNPQIDLKFTDKQTGEVKNINYTAENITVSPGESKEVSINVKIDAEKYSAEISSPQMSPSQTIPVPSLYFCRICPTGTLTATLPAYMNKTNNASVFSSSVIRFVILIFFLIAFVFVSRFMCRTFCPFGAIYALCSKFALFKMSHSKELCINCGACARVCPMGIDPVKEVGHPECITCGDCQKICPKKAISRTNIFSKTK